MLLSQKTELRKLLAPELKQSLKILTLPHLELKSLIDEELGNNPFLEESPAILSPRPSPISFSRPSRSTQNVHPDENFDPVAQLTKPPSLQDTLLRQLEISAANEQERNIGIDIIGNLEESGLLIVPTSEIAARQRVTEDTVEKVLKIIQKFEPAGVAARTIQECLLIQYEILGENDLLVTTIIEGHLPDVALRKYELIAKHLQTSCSKIEECVKKIKALNPRPGQNYSHETTLDITPDIFIDEKDGDLEVYINQENLPALHINEQYRDILKKNNLSPEEKEYLKAQLESALELIKAIVRRRGTLRKVLDVITRIQKDALTGGMSRLKPLTLQEVADQIGMHESTVSRVVMNKYAQTPQGLIALKDFFTSRIQQTNGEDISSSTCKDLIDKMIDAEDKKNPLSDEDLAGILLEHNGIRLARRTIAKYREELKIKPSTLRRER